MAHHLANAWVDQGERVTVLAPQGACTPADYSRRYALVEDFLSQVKCREGAQSTAEEKRIHALLDRVLVVHEITHVICLHPFYYGLPAISAALARRIPCGVYFHGFEFYSQLLRVGRFDTLTASPDMTRLPWKVWACVRNGTRVFVNSRYTRDLIASATGRTDILVTGCGLENTVLQRYSGRRPNLIGRTGSTIEFTYVGRLIQSKRVDRLIQWCTKSPLFRAHVVGDGPERESLETLVKTLQMTERVRFYGAVSEAEKYQILESSHFVALLSEENENTGQIEGFGIALLEGMAAGAIPVSSGSGGMGDIVKQGQTGFMIDDMTEPHVLLDFCGEPARIQQMGDSIRSDLNQRFNWPAVARLILEGM